jgi:hypothetical protein
MSRDPVAKTKRNQDIKEACRKLEAETVNGIGKRKVQKYTREAVVAILSNRFYLAERTIENILYSPDEEVPGLPQLDLFPP